MAEENRIKPLEWKCPHCKRVRKYGGVLMLKVCGTCMTEMKLVEKKQ